MDWIEANSAQLIDLSKKIWKYAELGLEEHRSFRVLADFLSAGGFTLEEGVAGFPTAFVAVWGQGRPVLGINCEYDALPGLSQEPTAQKRPRIPGAPGHGCGHNLLGTGAAGAAVALKQAMEKHHLSGTIKVFGTPAEEICAGKSFMARAGVFTGMDAIIDWHPFFMNQVLFDTCNAYFNLKYHFKGRTSHGNSPWEGKSALDSAVLMGHAIELLREHIPPGEPTAANTINYTFSDVGPEYPNVVPDRATLWCIGRIQSVQQMEPILAQIRRCAEGAAMATGTEVTEEFVTVTHEKIPNSVLSKILHKNLVELGVPSYTPEEEAFARDLQKSCNAPEVGMDRLVQPFGPGSTYVSDNSEYSWFAPFAMVWVATAPPGMGWHNWQVNAASHSSLGWKGMLLAAKVLMSSAVDLLIDGTIIPQAKAELTRRLAGREYKVLLPPDTPPPLDINRKTMDRYRHLLEEKRTEH
ncbi:MAG: amidohydrolase [Syntrophaceae bacterium]|nr:amidohydrolase [Syntrophaceae bacterium]